ncbi:hypothetical protein Y032_0049g1770 [Ancylostoma ceylanicum]|uniref:Uncharacterized protein n=1 Tax=Ancylostoma ceylanicum TaxID=53326 RepID=A0A016UA21_9BILA|nr:hypothetical protein Y032_0049g1770 [Ancylostoma ceylanicum]
MRKGRSVKKVASTDVDKVKSKSWTSANINATKVDQAILQMIRTEPLPLSIVKEPECLNFLNVLMDGYKSTLTISFISNLFDTLYGAYYIEFSEALKNATGVSITTDGWAG